MRSTIAVGRDVRRAMIAHAREAAPRECCGLLVGTGRRVHAALPCRNRARSINRYRLDPRDHIRVQRELRGTRFEIVGVYHSHPHSPARPSPSDIAEATSRDWIYAIVSLQHARAVIGGFRIQTPDVVPVRFVPAALVSYRAGV